MKLLVSNAKTFFLSFSKLVALENFEDIVNENIKKDQINFIQAENITADTQAYNPGKILGLTLLEARRLLRLKA